MSNTYLTALYPSPVGELTLALADGSLAGLWIDGQKHFMRTTCGKQCREGTARDFSDLFAWLDEYFAGKNPNAGRLSLAPEGTGFCKDVWRALTGIPYGARATYGQIAKALEESTGKKTSPRAVGGAVARNPVSIIIPCHRVVGAGGALTGYAGGLEVKKALLALEGGRT